MTDVLTERGNLDTEKRRTQREDEGNTQGKGSCPQAHERRKRPEARRAGPGRPPARPAEGATLPTPDRGLLAPNDTVLLVNHSLSGHSSWRPQDTNTHVPDEHTEAQLVRGDPVRYPGHYPRRPFPQTLGLRQTRSWGAPRQQPGSLEVPYLLPPQMPPRKCWGPALG